MTRSLPPQRATRSERRAAWATITGCVVESYDFTVYTYLIVFIAPMFFPGENPTAGILSSLLVFAAGFVARPLGGLFFGRMGDRIGRRKTLLVTIVLMGAATVMMGALPTYDQIGITAPVLLVVARLLQGFSAGGELTGAAVYASEHGGSHNRGRFNSLQPFGFAAGSALAPAVVGLTAVLVPAGAMGEWGWRIPLLAVLPLTIGCLLLRRLVAESPQFTATAAAAPLAGEGRPGPLRTVFRRYPIALVQTIALVACNGVINYTIVAYLPVFLQSSVGVPTPTVSWTFSIAVALSVPFVLLSGLLTDRFGRRKVLLTGLVGVTVLFAPLIFVVSSPVPVLVLGVAVFVAVSVAQMLAPPLYATFTSLFPTEVRYTGVALGMTVGLALGGGFGPYFAASLTASTGSNYAPGLLIVGAAVIGVVALLTAKVLPDRPVTDPVEEDGPLLDKPV